MTPELLAKQDGSSGINAVRMKDLLRDIQVDCANLIHGRLSFLCDPNSHTLAR